MIFLQGLFIKDVEPDGGRKSDGLMDMHLLQKDLQYVFQKNHISYLSLFQSAYCAICDDRIWGLGRQVSPLLHKYTVILAICTEFSNLQSQQL